MRVLLFRICRDFKRLPGGFEVTGEITGTSITQLPAVLHDNVFAGIALGREQQDDEAQSIELNITDKRRRKIFEYEWRWKFETNGEAEFRSPLGGVNFTEFGTYDINLISCNRGFQRVCIASVQFIVSKPAA